MGAELAENHLASLDRLQAVLRDGIPLTGFMQITIAHCDARELRLKAPYECNRNHKGAAFGGSLSALAVVTGWSVLELACRERAADAEIVISHLEMDFLAPITTDLISRCDRPGPDVLAHFFDILMMQRKAALDLNVTIEGARVNSVRCRGTYVALQRGQVQSKRA